MISLSFTLEIFIAIILMSVMYVSMNVTNGAFFKNVAIYALLRTIVMVITLGGVGGVKGIISIVNIAFIWVLYGGYCIEGLPMVWLMSKVYEWADGKIFVTISVIGWLVLGFIMKYLLQFLVYVD